MQMQIHELLGTTGDYGKGSSWLLFYLRFRNERTEFAQTLAQVPRILVPVDVQIVGQTCEQRGETHFSLLMKQCKCAHLNTNAKMH